MLGLNFKLCRRVWHFCKEWSFWKHVTCISEYWSREKVWEMWEAIVFSELKVQSQRTCGIPYLRLAMKENRHSKITGSLRKSLWKHPVLNLEKKWSDFASLQNIAREDHEFWMENNIAVNEDQKVTPLRRWESMGSPGDNRIPIFGSTTLKY